MFSASSFPDRLLAVDKRGVFYRIMTNMPSIFMKKIFACFVLAFFLSVPSCLRAMGNCRLTIMGLGDSITEGGDGFSSYLYPLWERLFTAGYDVDFVGPRRSECRIGWLNHCGFSGKPVEFLDERIDSIYRRYPADIVLLHAGHNHFADERPVDGMIRTYASIINKIHAINPQAYVFMAKVTPSGKLPKYSYIPELNRRIEALVDSIGSERVVLVDMASGHDWRTMTIDDKVHPNRRGREFMADVWMKAIASVFKPQHEAFSPEKVCYRRDSLAGDLELHVFRAHGDKPKPAVIYFFAGGWKYGSPLQFYRECLWHARNGITGISVDYSIKYLGSKSASQSVEDGRAALAYIRAHAGELGIDTSRIVVAGASAGGAIAGKMEDSVVCARMLYYPVVDSLADDVETMHKPILFMMGSKDSFTPMAKAKDFEAKLREQSTIVESHYFEGLGHPLFRYRECLGSVFYDIREITDRFLSRVLK